MPARKLFILFLASLLFCSFCFAIPCGAQETVPVTIDTVPAGLQVTVDGASYTAPHVFQWTPLSGHNLWAPSPQGALGTQHLFDFWSDGGDQYHTIFTPYNPATYTSHFITQH